MKKVLRLMLRSLTQSCLRLVHRTLTRNLKRSSREGVKVAPLPPHESERIKALHHYEILDTPPEKAFDDLTALASYICGTPIALVSFVDVNRQWFKSKVGLSIPEIPRDEAFCDHAILQPDKLLVVPNALQDQQFANRLFVTSAPNIQFYAGTPLVTPDGQTLGTLCVMDQIPRRLDSTQLSALQALGCQVMTQLELRLHVTQLERTVNKRKRAEETLRESEEKYRSVVDNLKEVIFQTDKIGRAHV